MFCPASSCSPSRTPPAAPLPNPVPRRELLHEPTSSPGPAALPAGAGHPPTASRRLSPKSDPPSPRVRGPAGSLPGDTDIWEAAWPEEGAAGTFPLLIRKTMSIFAFLVQWAARQPHNLKVLSSSFRELMAFCCHSQKIICILGWCLQRPRGAQQVKGIPRTARGHK